MSHKCCRCSVKAPNYDVMWDMGWAALHTGGVMCPKCYEGLSAVRVDAKNYFERKYNEYMEVNKEKK